MVDSSGSVGDVDWIVALQFVGDVISAFEIGPGQTKVAIPLQGFCHT